MMPELVQTNAVARFTCLGAECPDTCCQGWAMQVGNATLGLYQQAAPVLLNSVTTSPYGAVMRRDAVSDACVKLEAGWCGIQREYGVDFLGDACHFFPRITRALDETIVMSAALSCPEAARHMLLASDGFDLSARQEMRLPYSLKNYLPAQMDAQDALAIHTQFMAVAGDAACRAERSLMRISAIAQGLAAQPLSAWREAMPLYMSMADGRIPEAEPMAADIFNLLHALHGLAMASGTPRARLMAVIERMAAALRVTFHPSGAIVLAAESEALAQDLLAQQRERLEAMQPMLRRYLQAQLSQALFPWAGLGENISERIMIIGVRFATVKLALSCGDAVLSAQEGVEMIQILSRLLDHLADPQLSLQIYAETGWIREARLRAIVGE